MSPLDSASRLVNHSFPDALAVILGGSAARGDETPTSDLDIVVVIKGERNSYRETIEWEGRPVELFVYTLDELPRWWRKDAADRKIVLADMCAHGIALKRTATSDAVQRDAAAFITGGPAPLSARELDARRYMLTDALHDLEGGGDRGEQLAVAAQVFTAVTELALVAEGNWLGSGKWLMRRLNTMNPQLADQLTEAFTDLVSHTTTRSMIAVADEVLDQVGGRLTYGYKVG